MERNYTVVEVSPGVMEASGLCVFTKKPHTTAHFPKAAYEAWKAGGYIQNALAMLSADDREFLLTGICPTAFDAEFKEL